MLPWAHLYIPRHATIMKHCEPECLDDDEHILIALAGMQFQPMVKIKPRLILTQSVVRGMQAAEWRQHL